MNNAICMGIYGRRGSGKSTAAKREAAKPHRKAVVVFDPLGEYPYTQYKTLTELKNAMRKQWRKGFRLAYVPDGEADMIDELHRLCKLLWAVQYPYQHGQLNRQLTLVVDEAQVSYPNHLPRDKGGAKLLTLQGRHRGIEMILVTQRPSNVNTDYRAQCSKVIVFNLTTKTDRQAVSVNTSDDIEKQIAALNTYECLIWTPNACQKSNSNGV